jgi:hypothetical protein
MSRIPRPRKGNEVEPPMAVPNPEDFAIVIGINHYPQVQPLLQSAEEDARRFALWLLDPEGGGLDVANVHTLIGQNYAEANQTLPPIACMPNQLIVDGALQLMQADQKERVGRRLYFYFSGHGIGVGLNNVAMLLANAGEGRYHTCHIALEGYRDWLRDAAAFDELIFILDCCRNRENVLQTISPMLPHFLRNPQFKDVKPLTVLATLDGDSAFEGADSDAEAVQRRGLLTQALMEGLEKRLAVDSTGAVTAASLADWLKIRVPQLAQAKGLKQQAKVPDPPDLILVPPSPSAPVAQPVLVPQVTFTVTITPGRTGPMRLTRGSEPDKVEKHDAAVSPWVFFGPRNELYLIEHPASGLMRPIRPVDIQGDEHGITI